MLELAVDPRQTEPNNKDTHLPMWTKLIDLHPSFPSYTFIINY